MTVEEVDEIYALGLDGLMDLSDDESKPESVSWREWWQYQMEQVDEAAVLTGGSSVGGGGIS